MSLQSVSALLSLHYLLMLMSPPPHFDWSVGSLMAHWSRRTEDFNPEGRSLLNREVLSCLLHNQSSLFSRLLLSSEMVFHSSFDFPSGLGCPFFDSHSCSGTICVSYDMEPPILQLLLVAYGWDTDGTWRVRNNDFWIHFTSEVLLLHPSILTVMKNMLLLIKFLFSC